MNFSYSLIECLLQIRHQNLLLPVITHVEYRKRERDHTRRKFAAPEYSWNVITADVDWIHLKFSTKLSKFSPTDAQLDSLINNSNLH